MKGSSPAGQTTQQTINPTQQMQAPFLQGGWNSALNLFDTQPLSYYPGQTLADYRAPDPMVGNAYNNIYNAGQNVAAGLPAFNANYASMGQYAPQIAGYANQAAQNNNAGLNSLMQTAQGGGPGMEQLARSARGEYLNSNPYLDAAIQAAQDPTIRNYQTSIAPTIDAALAQSGRYGSGAQAGLYDTSQRNLGRALGDISTNMSNADYGRERGLQDAAAQQYSGLTNQAGNAYGQLYNSGLGLGMTGLTAATDIQRQIASLFPQWAAAQGLPAQAELQAGQGLTQLGQTQQAREQAQLADQRARFEGNQAAPYDTLNRYLENIGAKSPVGGTSSVSSPYFQNQGANILGGLTGAAGLANSLGGLGGLGGAGTGAALSGISSGALPAVIAPGISSAGLGSLAAMNAGTSFAPALAAAAAPAAWIICTELMRQGKLPKRHWAAGLPVFDRYPEIVKRGYYVWAIPSVKHLRQQPGSRYSRLLGVVFRWRAEDIAARRGVKGARKLWRGRAVTAALALPCLAIGLAAGEQDWRQVYKEKAI